MRPAAPIAILPCVLAACTPVLVDDTSMVTAPRLLAVQASPAEAPADGTFSMKALYVGPTGALDASSLNWAICLLQKPLSDPGSFNPACFVDASSGLTPIGTGDTARGTVPEDACELFGPDVAPAQPGQPSPRPTDPDSTGGFYLPVRVDAGGQFSVAAYRITCPPGGVTQQVFTEFSDDYKPNQNPVLSSLSLVGADAGSTPLGSATPPLTVVPGEHVTLRAAWPTCPTTPAECGGAETYLYIDPTSEDVTTQRESIVASYYATAGSFDTDSVGRASDDLGTTVDDGWTAPTSVGPVNLWVVLRDARGGVGWGSYVLTVAAR